MTASLSLTSTDLQAQARISSVSVSADPSDSLKDGFPYMCVIMMLCVVFNVFALICIPFLLAKRPSPQREHLRTRTPEVTVTVDHSRKTVCCLTSGPLARHPSVKSYPVSEIQKVASGVHEASPAAFMLMSSGLQSLIPGSMHLSPQDLSALISHLNSEIKRSTAPIYPSISETGVVPIFDPSTPPQL
ncbi:hypothetical protein GEMRC1_000654 [Eukaryota sp. GEM-RC1]